MLNKSKVLIFYTSHIFSDFDDDGGDDDNNDDRFR